MPTKKRNVPKQFVQAGEKARGGIKRKKVPKTGHKKKK